TGRAQQSDEASLFDVERDVGNDGLIVDLGHAIEGYRGGTAHPAASISLRSTSPVRMAPDPSGRRIIFNETHGFGRAPVLHERRMFEKGMPCKATLRAPTNVE